MAKISFYYSVMGGGKTTYLIQTEYAYRQKGFKTLILKPTVDDREGAHHGWGPISSRVVTSQQQALYVDAITPEVLNGLDYNMIFVDELQFFTPQDVDVLADIADKQNIPVMCYGLKTDVNGHLFAGSAALLAVADDIKEIEYPCACGRKATHHIRKIDGKIDTTDVAIAVEKGNITYEAVCRQCWKSARKNS